MTDNTHIPMTPEDGRIWARLKHVWATYQMRDGWLLRRRAMRAQIRDELVMFKRMIGRA